MAAERQPPQPRGCHHDLTGPLHKTTLRQHTGGSRGSSSHAPFTPRSCVPFLLPSDAGGCEAALLSVGRHHRRRIMCNYNRQSKTKPFTFNEFLLEKGRLPQGGILMKQMAECSQGQTQTVLLFTFCQHFQHSEEPHLSLDHSLCASVCERERESVCVCVWKTSVYWHISEEKINNGYSILTNSMSRAPSHTHTHRRSHIWISQKSVRRGVHIALCYI